MKKFKNRYQEMEFYMTAALIVDFLFFILFMIVAGSGLIWLKVISIILTIALSGLCLALLYFSNEILRQRSLWMTVAAAAILICLLFSLILNFPSPNPYV